MKLSVKCSALLLAVLLFSSVAFAWAPGTHAYIASQLKTPSTPDLLYNQMYGAMAADVDEFFTADPSYLETYFHATHYQPKNVWRAAQSMPVEDKALAFGFASHNEAWGADHNAHIGSFLYGRETGYVIAKSQVLCGTLRAQLTAAGMTDYLPIITDMNCHFILEYGIDLLMARQDPGLGMNVYMAAATRDPNFGLMMVSAFPTAVSPYASMGQEFAFAEAMTPGNGGNMGWNLVLQQYGYILSLPEEQRIPAVAQFLTQLAMGLGVLPPTNDEQQLAAMRALIQLALLDSMQICAPDLSIELNATIKHVGVTMKAHKINY
jgi:hypothetical protein